MRFSTIVSAIAFSTVTLAAPSGKEWCDKGDYKKGGLKGDGGKEWPKDSYFTSKYNVVATPDQVYNATNRGVGSFFNTPGQPGAIGYFNYGINSKDDVICYDIILKGVTGDYQSPAKTATHIHEGARKTTGPPRIAFPNPVGDDKYRRSKGCLKGPFTTGVLANGVDTGTGFKVAQIEKNPAGFFTDSHTKLYVPGVVRGQLA